MKILVLGDFHGKFPVKIKKIIKDRRIDAVISTGDYPSWSLKGLFFKLVYRKEDALELWEAVGKKKYKELIQKDQESAKFVFEKMDVLPVPVFTVLGNYDYPANDVADRSLEKSKWGWEDSRKFFYSDLLKKYKNIMRIDYSHVRFKDFIFIGMRGSSFPGRVKSKAYKKHRAILEKLFKRFRKKVKEGKVIFVAHNSPYDTKLDLITARDAHKIARGKHYGSKMFRRLIDKYHPLLSLSGHIEEAKGKQKLGKTLAVNCGSVHNGDAVIIELNGKKIKTSFLKI